MPEMSKSQPKHYDIMQGDVIVENFRLPGHTWFLRVCPSVSLSVCLCVCLLGGDGYQ